ncbi:hypothetical protein RA280_35580 [Cupriavidus sp. CV2]|uniref:hypothetical protein n=1 Tax=Cupriavidus ulmosensis TaxID=3065913 RepID=UPI00296AA5E0|nr:hypothetical protein [Cupriavidus sp. CV2]MDW3686969.1 hypothetical protein [Cupriavidus sp. CV2]
MPKMRPRMRLPTFPCALLVLSGRHARLAALAVASAFALPVCAADSLKFDQVFDTRGEPSALHFQVSYASAGSEHRLEVWREGLLRLRRRSDQDVDSFITRPAGSAEWSMSVLDHQRKIHTRISRTNLFRLGNFSDWFDLAHGLKRPMGPYRLRTAAAPGGAPKAIDRCDWYVLEAGEAGSAVCWSERFCLPLLMLDQQGHVIWRTTAIAIGPLPSDVFDIKDGGYVLNDANADIEPD